MASRRRAGGGRREVLSPGIFTFNRCRFIISEIPGLPTSKIPRKAPLPPSITGQSSPPAAGVSGVARGNRQNPAAGGGGGGRMLGKPYFPSRRRGISEGG